MYEKDSALHDVIFLPHIKTNNALYLSNYINYNKRNSLF